MNFPQDNKHPENAHFLFFFILHMKETQLLISLFPWKVTQLKQEVRTLARNFLITKNMISSTFQKFYPEFSVATMFPKTCLEYTSK